jgi:peroxiredoxin
MVRPTERAALILFILPLALGACGGKGLGVEVAGGKGNVPVSYSANVRVIAPSDRKPPKAFAGTLLDGSRTVKHTDLAGRVTVVNFWGAWCGECYQEQPLLNRAYEQFSPRGVAFLGVDVRDPHKADALSFVEHLKVPYPSIYDPDLQVAFGMDVYHFPSTYVLDRAGKVAVVIVSLPRSYGELARLIEQVLA